MRLFTVTATFLATMFAGIAVIGFGAHEYAALHRDPTVELVQTFMDGATVHHGICAGVYVGDRTVITAAHCVSVDDGAVLKGYEAITSRDGMPAGHLPATVIWVDPGQDVAAVRLGGMVPELGTATLYAGDAAIDTPIEVVGQPLTKTFIHTRGYVAGVVRDLGDPWHYAMPINVQVLPGNSGGPVYVEGTHKVVGIVVGGSLAGEWPGTLNYAISSAEVLRLIAFHNINI